ncbi:50S ribosomal protein L6 [Candidatus Pandoraea novymonadis]|uniref:Large ribosomal subunit protein uL6 n=1 Tax=Candidatus Pandoraea novymonadis TaxID=1808959 RepID=A0ABX5FCG5_9BURK|nr:50S ribosomal protein L6 [Candidatus Pandoraea novymonadis]PSB91534.1 50S ribosomal protein L6 [Candidatus Pandoraea novymonadis]
MSRVGKSPIILNKDVEALLAEKVLTVNGPLGSLIRGIHPLVDVKVEGSVINFSPVNESREARALYGTERALVNNMVMGVSKGFEKKLLLVGVGYRAKAEGNVLKLELGFSHDVVYQMPEGVTVTTPTQTEIIIKSVDKQRIGQVAAEIRAYRPPEPYKGKGVRYADEVLILKETKKK